MPKYGSKKSAGYRRSNKGVITPFTSRVKSSRRNLYRKARITKMVPFRSKWESPQVGKKYIKFRYMDTGFDTSTTALAPQYVHSYRGNGMYDPDATGVGVSPYFYDQWITSTLFSSWTVIGAKITIYPKVISTPGYQKVILYSSLTPSALTNTDYSDIKNIRGSVSMVINQESLGGREGGKKLSLYRTTKQMFPNRASGDNGFVGTYNTDPSVMWYFSVLYDQTDDAVNDIDSRTDVRVTYYAILSGPVKNVNES